VRLPASLLADPARRAAELALPAPFRALPHLSPSTAGVADVPLELQRQFGLMRELDERAYRLQQQVDADMLQQLKLAGQQQQQGAAWEGSMCGGTVAASVLFTSATRAAGQSGGHPVQ